MPTPLKFPTLAILFVAAALLAIPASASATLTFSRGALNSAILVARDDGSGARKIANGSNPRVTPDGLNVVYLHQGPGHAQEMRIAPAPGGPSRTLLKGWRAAAELAFSPDSTKLAALRGPELGKRKLVVIEIATGAQKVLGSGFFEGFSFSPDGTEIVYSKARTESYPPRSDVFVVPTAGGKARAITSDHRSLDPLWGPHGRIVFVKLLDEKTRKYGPKNELYLMDPDGTNVKRLTHTRVGPLLQGLFPTDWSADGHQLLAEFGGQDTSYAVTVNPRTGAQKVPGPKGEQGFVGTALSANGKVILGFTGGFEPGPNHDVATVPYAGGKKPKVLVRNGFEPDWSL